MFIIAILLIFSGLCKLSSIFKEFPDMDIPSNATLSKDTIIKLLQSVILIDSLISIFGGLFIIHIL